MSQNQKLLKDQIKAYTIISSLGIKNADFVVDFMFQNFDLFFKNTEQIGMSQKEIFSFIQYDSNLHKKTDAFINQISIQDFNRYEPKILKILNKQKSKAYDKKQQEQIKYSEVEEVIKFLSNIESYGLSFLGNDQYTDLKSEIQKLKNIDIKSIPSDVAVDFIKEIFKGEGALEWSVDGDSRMKSAKLMEPVYMSDEVIQLTQREFKKDPQLNKYVGREVASVINFITEWSVRPIDNNAKTTFNLSQQKKLLSICSNIINTHKIKISKSDIWDAKDYESVADRDSDENGYRKQRKLKFDEVQSNLDSFKQSIQAQAQKLPSLSKPRR